MSTHEYLTTPFERVESDANARWFQRIRGAQHMHTSAEAYDAAAQAQQNGEPLPHLDEDDPAVAAAICVAEDEHDRVEAARRADRVARMAWLLLRAWWAA